MPGLSAANVNDELLAQGHRMYALYKDNRWRARRIETIRLSSSHEAVRSVTLDVDTGLVATIVGSTFDGERQPIPLSIIPKLLGLDLDARNDVGNAVPLLTSDVNSRLSTAAVLACLENHNACRADFSDSIVGTIYKLVSTLPIKDQATALAKDATARWNSTGQFDDSFSLKIFSSDGHEVQPDNVPMQQRDTDSERWESWLREPEVFKLLRELSLGFLPLVEVELDRRVHILQYKYCEIQVFGKDPMWDARWLWKRSARMLPARGNRSVIIIPARAIRLSVRTHTIVEAPPGLIIASAALHREDSSGRNWGLGQYRYNVSADRAVFYASGIPEGSYVMSVSLRPSPAGLLTQARYLVLASAILLTLGGIAELSAGRSLDSNVEASVILLVLLPTILMAFLWREGEHEALSQLLRRPRLCVAAVVGFNMLCGIVLAGALPPAFVGCVWLVSGLGSGAIFVWLTYQSQVSKNLIADHSAHWADSPDITSMSLTNAASTRSGSSA